jgi:hypothetical protein
MKIYKFKSLSEQEEHSHFLQIVLEKKIWCASPDSLNDKDELKFELDYQPTSKTHSLFAEVLQKYGSEKAIPPLILSNLAIRNGTLADRAKPIIERMINQARSKIGITSFSLKKSSTHLWSEYGGKGNGVRIEIVIPDSLANELYHPVLYISKKVFHVDSFFEATSGINSKEMYKNMFLTKSKEWEKEKEIRYIAKEQNFACPFNGQINEIAFGPNVTRDTSEFLIHEISKIVQGDELKITRLSTI